jgi:hypothetical protein
MKLYTLAILVLILAMASCRKNPSLAQKNAGHDSSTAFGAKPAYDTAAHYDSLLGMLIALQDGISGRPENSGLIAPLLHAAYDQETGCFYVVGKGAHSPNLPEVSWEDSGIVRRQTLGALLQDMVAGRYDPFRQACVGKYQLQQGRF